MAPGRSEACTLFVGVYIPVTALNMSQLGDGRSMSTEYSPAPVEREGNSIYVKEAQKISMHCGDGEVYIHTA